jgi:hypothetical protein
MEFGRENKDKRFLNSFFSCTTKEKGFCNLFFGWMLDKNLTRLIFCTVPDVNGRNFWRVGNSLIHFPRYVELGLLGEGMRVTEFINAQPLHKRQRLSALAELKPIRASEELMRDLWDFANERLPVAHFLKKYVDARSN